MVLSKCMGVSSLGRRVDLYSKFERREYHIFKLFQGRVKLVYTVRYLNTRGHKMCKSKGGVNWD